MLYHRMWCISFSVSLLCSWLHKYMQRVLSIANEKKKNPAVAVQCLSLFHVFYFFFSFHGVSVRKRTQSYTRNVICIENNKINGTCKSTDFGRSDEYTLSILCHKTIPRWNDEETNKQQARNFLPCTIKTLR